MIAQTAPSPTPMLDSPSEVIGRARCPVTRAVAGSIREIPPGSQVAVQTAPNPSSVAAHGPCGTATEPSGRPVRASYTPTPLPSPEIHARPWATSVQSGHRRPRNPPRSPADHGHPPSLSPPAGGCVNTATGTPRPPPPRPASTPWPGASNAWTTRPPSTPGPSPPWSRPGERSCSPDAESAPSWPHRCCAPGPMPAAAAPTPPSPYWAEPRPSPPQRPDHALSAQPVRGPPAQPGPARRRHDQTTNRPSNPRLRPTTTRPGQDQPRDQTLPGPLRRRQLYHLLQAPPALDPT